MDQGLAVHHAEGAATLAFHAQALLVAEVVIDAVDDVEAIGARRDKGHGEPGHDGEAVMQRAGARRTSLIRSLVPMTRRRSRLAA